LQEGPEKPLLYLFRLVSHIYMPTEEKEEEAGGITIMPSRLTSKHPQDFIAHPIFVSHLHAIVTG